MEEIRLGMLGSGNGSSIRNIIENINNGNLQGFKSSIMSSSSKNNAKFLQQLVLEEEHKLMINFLKKIKNKNSINFS